MYVEDFKRGPNKEVGPKDIFEMGSQKKSWHITPMHANSLILASECTPGDLTRFLAFGPLSSGFGAIPSPGEKLSICVMPVNPLTCLLKQKSINKKRRNDDP